MENVNNKNRNEAIERRNTLFFIIGWIAAFLSLIAYPFITGIIGVTMGILTTKNGSRAGLYLIVFSIIFMGIGLIFSSVIMNFTRHILGIV
jgi:hypothetical protein